MGGIILPIVYKDFFPTEKIKDPNNELICRLKTLCRTEVLKYCIHLNLFISDLIGLMEQKEILGMFFDAYELKVQFQFPPVEGGAERTFFHRPQLLEMIHYAVRYCPDSNCHKTPLQNKGSKRKFIKASLLATEISLSRAGLSKTEDIEQFKKSGTENEKRGKLLRFVRLNAQG